MTAIALSYRRAHVLEIGEGRWEIQAVWELFGKRTPPTPRSRIRFDLELSTLDPDWQAAITRARKLGAEGAKLDGVPLDITLNTVNLQFSTFVDQVEPRGDASFGAVVETPLPFPRSLDDAGFVAALVKAAATSTVGPIQADEIEERERYWIFPVHHIGANGVIVDRRSGDAFETAGGLERELWIWGHEHGLLSEPARDLVIEAVGDRDRALAALKAFARVRREDLDQLPLVLRACAGWTAIHPLFDANDALVWRVGPA